MTDPITVAAQLATAYAQLAASADSSEEALEFRRTAIELADWAHGQWQAALQVRGRTEAHEASAVEGERFPLKRERVEPISTGEQLLTAEYTSTIGPRIDAESLQAAIGIRHPQFLYTEPTLPEEGNEDLPEEENEKEKEEGGAAL